MSYPSRLLERVSAPALEPISLSEAKIFLRIDSSDEDSVVGDIITAARLMAEEVSGKSLISQSWKIAYDDCSPQEVGLPFRPVQSVSSVKVFDENEVETVVSSADYALNAAKDLLVFSSVPSGHRVEIIYVTGFGASSSDVPADIRQAMLVHIAHMYEQRDSMHPPLVSQMIYAQHHEVRL